MCGIVGIFDVQDASRVAAHALQRVQHRGQDAAGIVASDGKELHRERAPGSVTAVFENVDFASKLPGRAAIGHTRYATAGKGGIAKHETGSKRGIQPLIDDSRIYPSAYAHNGTIPDAEALCIALEERGASFASRSDTELFLHGVKRSRATSFPERLIEACRNIDGAYSLLVITLDKLYAVRDPHGFRPLFWAPYSSGVVVASETCVFDLLGIKPEAVAEVAPGTLLEFSMDRAFPRVARFASATFECDCSFEDIYFARPDSFLKGRCISTVREELGRRLAHCFPVRDADIVIPVPDSAICHAIGYAEYSGLPFKMGLVRSHAVGRTFIDPRDDTRAEKVRLKLSSVRGVLDGKRVVVIDDSVVRSTTAREVIAMLRRAGAIKVHLRVASPPVIGPCQWGINTPTREELIANRMTKDQIALLVGADSLEYLPVEELRQALGDPEGCRHCFTCFTGKHPTKP